MKGSARMTVLIALAAVLTLVLLVEIGPFADGEAMAQGAPDFTITGAAALFTNETTTCFTPSILSCYDPFYDSDLYNIVASVDASSITNFGTDLAEKSIYVQLRLGTCGSTTHLISGQTIPGSAIRKVGTGKRVIYSFDGSVPQTAYKTGFNPPQALFDHLTMRFVINSARPTRSALILRANANLCDWLSTPPTPVTSPIAMIIVIEDYPAMKFDQACIELTPTYSTMDASPAFCP